MRKIIIFSTLFLSFPPLLAQMSLRVYNFRPIEKSGAIFKPTINVEFGYVQPFDSRLRKNVFITLLDLKTRLDEIPSTGLIESGGKTTVTPGIQKFRKFLMLKVHGGYDFAFFKKYRYSAFVGANVVAGATYIDYSSKIDLIESSDIITVAYGIGTQFRIGLELYVSSVINLFIGANREVYFIYNEDVSTLFWSNQYGLGITYKF